MSKRLADIYVADLVARLMDEGDNAEKLARDTTHEQLKAAAYGTAATLWGMARAFHKAAADPTVTEPPKRALDL